MLRRILIGLSLVLAGLNFVVLRFDLPAAEVDAQYMTPHSRVATLPDGTRMHYWDRGRAEGPVLLLIHGSFDSADTWERWAPLLEEDFRLIAPDLPAHGMTGTTPSDDYSIEAMVAAVSALLDQLGIARAHVAGNSMGGNVSWRLALAHPEKVERMVLLDASGYPGLVDALSPRTSNPVMAWLVRNGNPALLVKRGLTKAVGEDNPELLEPDKIERAVAYLRREGSRDAHRLRREQRLAKPSPFERIPEIMQPTLILWGERDVLVPVEHAHRFARDLPSSKLLVYSEVDHIPQLEIPERSAKDARDFLLAPLPSPEPAAAGAAQAATTATPVADPAATTGADAIAEP